MPGRRASRALNRTPPAAAGKIDYLNTVYKGLTYSDQRRWDTLGRMLEGLYQSTPMLSVQGEQGGGVGVLGHAWPCMHGPYDSRRAELRGRHKPQDPGFLAVARTVVVMGSHHGVAWHCLLTAHGHAMTHGSLARRQPRDGDAAGRIHVQVLVLPLRPQRALCVSGRTGWQGTARSAA